MVVGPDGEVSDLQMHAGDIAGGTTCWREAEAQRKRWAARRKEIARERAAGRKTPLNKRAKPGRKRPPKKRAKTA